MINNVKELLELLAQVNLLLELKERSLEGSHSNGSLNNIKRKILALENDYVEIKERYSDKPEVFINFRKRVKEIMDEIDSLV